MSHIPWTKKYEPSKIDELELQNNIIVRIKNYMTDHKSSKPILLYGPPGTGKTVAAHVFAKEFEYELVEVNASDFRSKAEIEKVIGTASKQMSLFNKSKVILIDEIDCLTKHDRGALGEIIKLFKSCPYPIMLTANDPWDRSLNKLRKECNLIMFDRLDSKIIASILKKICIGEEIKYSDDDIRLLAIRASGDLRGAIIDLQTLVKDKTFDAASLQELTGRMQKQSVMNGLALIYRSKDAKISSHAFNNVDIDYNTQFNWLEENTAYAYDDPEEWNFAYNYLSLADIFNKRIRRWQHWRFIVHINALSTIGVSLAKTKPYTKFITFKETKRFLKMWLAKNKNAAKINFSKRVAEKTHCSYKDIYKDIESYKFILNNPQTQALFLKEFDMSKSDISFLFKG